MGVATGFVNKYRQMRARSIESGCEEWQFTYSAVCASSTLSVGCAVFMQSSQKTRAEGIVFLLHRKIHQCFQGEKISTSW